MPFILSGNVFFFCSLLPPFSHRVRLLIRKHRTHTHAHAHTGPHCRRGHPPDAAVSSRLTKINENAVYFRRTGERPTAAAAAAKTD